jgi:hypothetical protein
MKIKIWHEDKETVLCQMARLSLTKERLFKEVFDTDDSVSQE